MSKDLNLMNGMYMASPSYRFRVDLNEKYIELCKYIHKKSRGKNLARQTLNDICLLILHQWEDAKNLSREELYMVINCIKLARSNLEVETHEEIIGGFPYLAIESTYLKDNIVLSSYCKEDGHILLQNGTMYNAIATTFTKEEFNELEENYTNSR